MKKSDYKTTEQALEYENFRFSNGLEIIAENEESTIRNWLKSTNDLISIDLGSGTGRGLEILLKSNVKKIYAIDQSDAMLSLLKDKFRKEIKNNKISLLKGSSSNYKLTEESIDLVLSLHLFKHLSKITPTLTNINKSLKPNGLLIIDVLNKNSIINLNLDTCYALSKQEIINTLNRTGFKVEKIISMHILGETIYKYLPWGIKNIFNLIDKYISLMLPFSTKFFILAKKK